MASSSRNINQSFFPTTQPSAMHLPTIAPALSAKSSKSSFGPRPRASLATAGRKRSRDETSFVDDDSSDTSRQSASPPKAPALSRQFGKPAMGEGMTLIWPNHPSNGLHGASQTGTWAEELAERLRSSSVTERPTIDSRKSMRLDQSASNPSDADTTLSDASLDAVRTQPEQPAYDAASIALGVGWRTISGHANDTMAAAVRGWTAFVEERYPLQSVSFEWAKRSEPQGYLVGAITRWSRGPGYWLFQEDLQRARMVAKSWERALDNLRCVPPVFDGEELAAEDPMHMAMAEPYIADGMREHQYAAMTAAKPVVAVGGADGMDLD